ncbi:hypothetical protein Rsub_09875 [Raphidocelis subcapitata]|uniref:RAP domain-containing protein n=1 Tax=Raphidocelis subcapitata TaxID=307507 RepID=A0A2V0PG40_9CHLO|nr:hypothetical protein Rsub_09875 [Raphidocelis subcapitata]|eukprot:GBF96870.1 hypothetical protein Rsub_09875 [Raphidocelis subcapitata]
MRCLRHSGRAAAAPAPNACPIRRRIRARAAECVSFDVGSPSELRRLRTLTQSLQLDGLPAPAGGLPERSAAARAAAAAAAAAALASAPAADGGDAAVAGSDAEEESHLISRELKDCSCCQDVLDVLSDELSHMSPHNTVTALGRLSALAKRAPASDRAAALAAPPFGGLLRLLARQLPEMSAFQLVNALYSAAALGAPLSRVPGLLPAADAAVARLAPSFNDRDVCSALYAYALLRHGKPGSGAAAALLARAQSLLDARALEGRGVSMLLWAVGSLGLRHSGLTGAAERALLADGGALLRGMASQGVANCAWGLAKATGGQVDAALLDHALSVMASLGDDVKPQEVLNTLWACARCRHDPQAAWGPLLRYCERHAAALTPADVASLFHALGTFGRTPEPGAAPALLARARELLPRMAPLEAASLYRGLGLAGLADSDAWRDLTGDALPAAWAAGQLSDSTKRMAFQGFLAGRLSGAAEALPADMLLDLKAAWDQGLAARPRAAPPAAARRGGGAGGAAAARRAAPGCEVHSLLEGLGVRHDVDVATRDGLSVVDVQLRAGGGRWVALQVAGEHEFASNSGQKLGPAALQQSLLEKAGYEVRWLSARDVAGKPPHRRALYVAELLRALGVGVPDGALRAAEQQAEGGAAAAAPGGGARRRGGRGQAAGGGGGGAVVSSGEAELLFSDPKVSGANGRRRGGGGGGGKGGSRRLFPNV